MQGFRVGEAIRFGWETFKKRPWFLIATSLVVSIFMSLSVQTDEASWGDISAPLIVALVLAWLLLSIVQMLARMGSSAFMLKVHASAPSARWRDLWAPHPFWRFVGAVVLKGIVVAAPLMLVIGAGALLGMQYIGPLVVLGIPTVLWLIFASVRLIFVELIVMDRGLGPVEAMKESFRITEGSFWNLILFVLSMLGVFILGFLALLVGILVAIPVSMVAFVHVYKTLSTAKGARAN